jgi:hypothetical protein
MREYSLKLERRRIPLLSDGTWRLDTDRTIRCGIDAGYFPSSQGFGVSTRTRTVEEEDLLSSLHALATKDVLLLKGPMIA